MNTKNKIDIYWNLSVFSILTIVLFALPEFGLAASTTSLGNIICKANTLMETDVAKGLAVAAIIILGLMALLGKISWGLGLMVIVGIGLIFGADDILDSLGVKDACSDTGSGSGGSSGGSGGGRSGGWNPGGDPGGGWDPTR